ncbi:hypothetical protein HTY52_22855 [Cupriavidus taiwanensis]|uniref:packaged DNA stabilization protein n=1 Tax=Cupriavidus taiwanensis TaxID=164546 RepID=UPI00157431B5|nr:packaged DNA stabilization protein [Cupriavidus taiwanensis]NSX16936.1 hypothetical protein [Cupriavidus taiwanensis]
MARIPLTTGAGSTRSKIAGTGRQVNLYAEINPAGSPAPVTYYGTPGLKLWSTIPGDGPVRLQYVASNGVQFAVRGAKLYRYDAGSWAELTTLASTSGRVIAADNGTSAVFVDGTMTAPVVSLSTFTVTAMSGDGWYGANFVFFLNGRLIFNKPGTEQFYWTGLYTTTLDPLDFASAEGSPDDIVSMVVDHLELWLFGPTSLEIFYDSGDPDAPFVRMQGAFNEVGCIAPFSVNRLDNTIYWLGRDRNGGGMVFRAQNYQPQRVSDHALETAIASYETVEDAFSWTYQQAGHTFFVLTFPTAQKTWCFDVASNMWHEREYRLSSNQTTRHRANSHAYFEGKNLVGDFENGNVYELDLDTYTDHGAEILRLKDFPHMVADGYRHFFRQFVLDCQVAVGNGGTPVPGEPDPEVWLSWSDDGGNTWASTMVQKLGKIGEFWRRVQWNRLGMGRDRIFRVSTTTNAKFAMQGAFIESDRGTS